MLRYLEMEKALWLSVVLVLPRVVLGYTTEDLNAYMEDAIEDYKVKLHKATQTSVRVRRSLDSSDLINTGSSEGGFMSDIANITAWQSIPTSYPMELEPFQILQDNYMAVVNFKSKSGDYLTNSAVYHMDVNNTFHLLQNFTTSGGIDFEYADFGTEQYAIFLDHIGQNMYGGSTYGKYTYMKSFKMNQFLPHYDIKRPFQYRTKVRALGAKKVKVFTKDMNHYFVTANSFHERGDMYHVKSTMHVQTAFGYQLVQQFATQGAQDVEVEVIDGKRFIFFANQMDNSGSVDIYSTIFVENPSPQPGSAPFVMFQRIGTHGARDIEYFSFSGHHYLAVANEYTQVKSFDSNTGKVMVQNDYNVDSVIYWWTGSMWVQWQRIPTYGAVKWSFFESSYGDPMLVVANSKSQPVIFTYDYTRGEFIPAQVQDLSPIPGQVVVADTRSVMPFRTADGQQFLAVANFNPLYSKGYNLFKVTFARKPAPKADPTIPEIITKNLDKMRDELNVVQDSLRSLLSDVKLVMTRTTDQGITSPHVTFMNNVTITDTLSTSNFHYHDNSTENPLDASKDGIKDLKNRLEEQESKMAILQSKFDDAVLLNQDTKITGTKVFTSKVHFEGDLKTSNLSVNGTINGIKLFDLNTRTMKKSTTQTLTGNFNFLGNLSVGDAEVESLNGVRMRELMTTSTNQNVSGVMTFNDTVEIDSVMMNDNFTVNQIHIPRDVVTRNGNQTITGRKIFTNMTTTKDLRIKGLLDNINVTDFKRRMVTLTTNQTTNSSVVFQGGFSTLSDITVAGLVDGVNLTTLARNKTDDVEIVSGSVTFDNVRVKGSVLATEINGRDVRRMFTLNTTQNITAVMNFTSDVVVQGDVGVGKRVNGLDISEEVVLKHGNQTISGHKYFLTDISVLGNVTATGGIDGVDLEEWQRNAVMKGNASVVSGSKTFVNGAQISERLNVDTVNNISMASLRQGKLLINSNGSTWNNRFQFNNITIGELHLSGKVGGYRVPEDFVPLTANMTITGEKHFVGKTVIDGNFSVNGLLSGKNFEVFYDSVLKNNTDENIVGDVILHDVIMQNNVTVSGKVNGVSLPDDVVTLHTYQNLSNTFTLKTDTTFEDGVMAHVVEVNETVNGIDVADMERNAIYKDRNQTVNSSVIFIGGIDCKQNLSVSGLINNINLTDLLTMTVRVSQDQNITGIKTFTEDINVEAPVTLTSGMVNGINIKELDENALKKSGDQVVESDIVVNGDIASDSLRVAPTSLINNVNFTSFVENAARANESNTIHGNLEFRNGLVVERLSAPRVDGVSTEDILLTHGEQVVTGNVSFVEVEAKEMKVNGLVNGFNMREVEENALKLDGQQNITGRYTFQNLIIDGNVAVEGYLNGVNLTAFDESAVHLSSDEIISGKYFENVTFDNVTFVGHLNDVDVNMLFTDTLRRTVNHQTVCHTLRFQTSVTSSNTSLENVTVGSGLVNGVNIGELDKQAVKLKGNQILDGTYEFVDNLEVLGNLTVNGTVNNYSIPHDFMMTSGDQIITGTKTFSKTQFSGHLNMSGLIDGVNISDVDRKSVSLSRDQRVNEKMKFLSVVFDRDVILPNRSTVNHIDISESLVSTVSDSVVKGKKTFNWTSVRGDLEVSTGTVNNVNLTHLALNSLKRSSSTAQEVSADQVFGRNLVIKGNLNVSGLINGIRVASFKDYSKNIGINIRKEIQELSYDTKRLCNGTRTLLPAAITEQTLTGIDKMDVFQTFPTDSYLGKIDSKRIGDMIYISVARSPGAPCGPAYIIRCTPSLMCSVVQTIKTNAPIMEFLSYETFEALLVWHWKSGSNTTMDGCKQEPEIYTLNPATGTFKGYGSLNYVLFQSSMYAPFIGSSVVLAAYFSQHRNMFSDASSTTSLPMDIKFFERNGKNYLVVGSYEDNSHFVDILYINGTSLNTVKREQRFKTDGGSVSVGELETGKHVVATSTDGPKGNIKLYSYNQKLNKFEFYQRLSHSASSVKIQKVSHQPYLMYASAANGFGLCKWLGVSGFGQCVQLQLTDTSSIEPIITPYGAFTVAGTEKSIVLFRSKFAGNRKPYKADVC